jgi:hypothetical protein
MRYLHRLFNLYFKFFYVKKYIEVAYMAGVFKNKKWLPTTKRGLNGYLLDKCEGVHVLCLWYCVSFCDCSLKE